MTDGPILSAKTFFGTLRFDGRKIEISRKGPGAWLSAGKSQKVIPLSSITAVQFRPATLMFKGYVQFSVLGEVPLRGDVDVVQADENALVLQSGHSTHEVKLIVDAVNNALAMRSAGLSANDSREVALDPPASSVVDQLSKLADLLSSGLIDRAEFDDQKAQLLRSGKERPFSVGDRPTKAESQNASSQNFLWITDFPVIFSTKKINGLYDRLFEVLGIPVGTALGNELLDLNPLFALREADRKAVRYNRPLEIGEAQALAENLKALGLKVEIRPD